MGLVALIGVLTFGVLEGLLIAVGTSLIALLYHAASPHRAVLGYMPDDDSFHDVERFPDLTSSPGGVVVYRFDAPLFFANCRRLRDDVMALVVEPTEPVRAVIIDAGAITSLDVTGAGVISELIQQLQSKGIRLLFARTRGSVRDVMAASGILDTLGPQNLVATVHAGIASVL
jgi:SulP family sulfate permease